MNVEKIDPAPYRGKTIHVFGMLKSGGAQSARFWLRVDSAPNDVLSFDNMNDRALTGTHDWTPFSIIARVPQNAQAIYAGLLLIANGSLYGSNLQIEVVPDDTPVTGI